MCNPASGEEAIPAEQRVMELEVPGPVDENEGAMANCFATERQLACYRYP